MIDLRTVHTVKQQLFSAQGNTVFAILDGASVPDLPANLAQFNPEHACLYRGELEPDMAAVAPYLTLLERDAPFTEWVLSNGWGEHWGIFGTAQADLPALKRHFRSFTTVIDDSGRTLLLRFYDPRVWREYLGTCNRKELEKLFGPVCSYYQEGEEVGVIVRLVLVQGDLHEEETMLSRQDIQNRR